MPELVSADGLRVIRGKNHDCVIGWREPGVEKKKKKKPLQKSINRRQAPVAVIIGIINPTTADFCYCSLLFVKFPFQGCIVSNTGEYYFGN